MYILQMVMLMVLALLNEHKTATYIASYRNHLTLSSLTMMFFDWNLNINSTTIEHAKQHNCTN